MEQLSEHFTLSELTHTNTGLPNAPNAEEESRLKLLAEFMEKVRSILGDNAITVNSAFRSRAVNAAVGGVANSAHRLGYACDFTCATFGSPYQICVALDAAEKGGPHHSIGSFKKAHGLTSRDPRLRGQRLTKKNGGYENGILQS